MSSHAHEFDAREGGAFRISLTYTAANGCRQDHSQTDTYRGQFVRLVPDPLVVESMAFETADPALQGAMAVTFPLLDSGGGTDVLAAHGRVPPGIAPSDNALGWSMALDRPAQLMDAITNR